MKGSTLIKAVVFTLLLAAGPQAGAQEEMPAPAAEQININRADAATIALVLDGVGEARAEAIVAHREANGDFKSLEDLTMVSGIGEFTVRNNRDKIIFE